MKFAVIKTGGKQYKVAEGDIVNIEKIDDTTNVGDTVVFSDVLLVADDDTALTGKECEGKKVTAVLNEKGKSKKISVIKFRSKSDYKRHYGHRQPFWKVEIQSIA